MRKNFYLLFGFSCMSFSSACSSPLSDAPETAESQIAAGCKPGTLEVALNVTGPVVWNMCVVSLTGPVNVEGDLTITPGTRIVANTRASLRVNRGSLIAAGTPTSRIAIEGLEGIHLNTDAAHETHHSLRYVDVRQQNAIYGILPDKSSFELVGAHFESPVAALDFTGGDVSIVGSTVVAKAPVNVTTGKLHVIDSELITSPPWTLDARNERGITLTDGRLEVTDSIVRSSAEAKAPIGFVRRRATSDGDLTHADIENGPARSGIVGILVKGKDAGAKISRSVVGGFDCGVWVRDANVELDESVLARNAVGLCTPRLDYNQCFAARPNSSTVILPPDPIVTRSAVVGNWTAGVRHLASARLQIEQSNIAYNGAEHLNPQDYGGVQIDAADMLWGSHISGCNLYANTFPFHSEVGADRNVSVGFQAWHDFSLAGNYWGKNGLASVLVAPLYCSGHQEGQIDVGLADHAAARIPTAGPSRVVWRREALQAVDSILGRVGWGEVASIWRSAN